MNQKTEFPELMHESISYNPADEYGELLELTQQDELFKINEFQTQYHTEESTDLHSCERREQLSVPQKKNPDNKETKKLNVVDNILNEDSGNEREKAIKKLDRCAKRFEQQVLMLQQEIQKLRRAENILRSVKVNEKLSIKTIDLVRTYLTRTVKSELFNRLSEPV